MVAAARPINAAFHRLPNRQRCADSVGDHAAMLLHIRYKGGAQRTGIAGLAAALRVKGGPVQRYQISAFARFTGEDGGGEGAQEGVLIIELFRFHVEHSFHL